MFDFNNEEIEKIFEWSNISIDSMFYKWDENDEKLRNKILNILNGTYHNFINCSKEE